MSNVATAKQVRVPGERRNFSRAASPASRPLLLSSRAELAARFEQAIDSGDGFEGAHCTHELWMRGEMGVHVEGALERLWKHAADSIPDWLPTRHIDWLQLAYEASAQFKAARRGRSNVYLILLDYRDSRDEPYGLYVGMSNTRPQIASISTKQASDPPAVFCAEEWKCSPVRRCISPTSADPTPPVSKSNWLMHL